MKSRIDISIVSRTFDNDLFDVLNSASPKDSVHLRKPISSESESMTFLQQSLEWLHELATINANWRVSFINGFIQFINIILQLRHLLDQKNLPFFPGCNWVYKDCIAFAAYSNSQATMDIMLPSLRLEEPPSGQSHNVLNKQTVTGFNGHRFQARG